MSRSLLHAAIGHVPLFDDASLDEYLWIVVVGALAAFFMAYGIGANDVSNSFGGVVASCTLTMRQAMIIAALFEFTGAVLLGGSVTSTLAGGIADLDTFEREPQIYMFGMLCALVAAGLWLLLATYWSLPVSTTHSIIGAVLGFAFVYGGPAAVIWLEPTDTFPYMRGMVPIVVSWFVGPLLAGMVSAFFFWSIRTAILRQEASMRYAILLMPVLVLVTTFINLFFVLEQGADNKLSWPASKCAWVSAAVAGGAALIMLAALPAVARSVHLDLRRNKESIDEQARALQEEHQRRSARPSRQPSQQASASQQPSSGQSTDRNRPGAPSRPGTHSLQTSSLPQVGRRSTGNLLSITRVTESSNGQRPSDGPDSWVGKRSSQGPDTGGTGVGSGVARSAAGTSPAEPAAGSSGAGNTRASSGAAASHSSPATSSSTEAARRSGSAQQQGLQQQGLQGMQQQGGLQQGAQQQGGQQPPGGQGQGVWWPQPQQLSPLHQPGGAGASAGGGGGGGGGAGPSRPRTPRRDLMQQQQQQQAGAGAGSYVYAQPPGPVAEVLEGGQDPAEWSQEQQEQELAGMRWLLVSDEPEGPGWAQAQAHAQSPGLGPGPGPVAEMYEGGGGWGQQPPPPPQQWQGQLQQPQQWQGQLISPQMWQVLPPQQQAQQWQAPPPLPPPQQWQAQPPPQVHWGPHGAQPEWSRYNVPSAVPEESSQPLDERPSGFPPPEGDHGSRGSGSDDDEDGDQDEEDEEANEYDSPGQGMVHWENTFDQLRAIVMHGTQVDVHDVIAADSTTQRLHAHAEVFDPATESAFKVLQVLTSMCAAFSHGANDVANAAGPFAAIYYCFTHNRIDYEVHQPIWILVLAGAGMVVGILTYGYNIIRAISVKLSVITPSRGFCIELATSLVVLLASKAGLPISTTHCQVGSTAGMGLMEGTAGLNWRLLLHFFVGWIFTFFLCAFLSAVIFAIFAFAPCVMETNEIMLYEDQFVEISRMLHDIVMRMNNAAARDPSIWGNTSAALNATLQQHMADLQRYSAPGNATQTRPLQHLEAAELIDYLAESLDTYINNSYPYGGGMQAKGMALPKAP
ncbi:hypothetical protein HYH03_009779 [Edaphochlamys debaryana]|uniref:Phosphate transporter n=1 Tax=Edaphochlamys debaryana TaxID=47281 RepID=A0A835XVB8_9CHLO|nr:hypothetical protein HYH03_009779 [Edaphochlamys debaryana]|eukprot:KAG2491822.1 hypothetical protein HYH03_009779 [Edaphochlamys debaryana]